MEYKHLHYQSSLKISVFEEWTVNALVTLSRSWRYLTTDEVLAR